MAYPRGVPDEGLVGIQARIFEHIAAGESLSGTLHDLALQFGATPAAFLHCLDGLVAAGWVRLDGDQTGTFAILLAL